MRAVAKQAVGSFLECAVNIPCRKILFSRPRSRGLAAILGVCPARQCGSEHLSAQNAATPLCLKDPIRIACPGGSLVPSLGSPGVEEKLRGFVRCLVKWVTTNHLLPRDKEQRTQTSILSPNANVGGAWGGLQAMIVSCGPIVARSFQLFKIHQKLSFNQISLFSSVAY